MREHLHNLNLPWIAFGWFIAVSVTSLILLALDAAGIAGADAPAESLWVAIALAVSFVAAGFLVGTRVAAAPWLNGIGMGLFSVVAWVAVNLLLGEPTGAATWRSLPAS